MGDYGAPYFDGNVSGCVQELLTTIVPVLRSNEFGSFIKDQAGAVVVLNPFQPAEQDPEWFWCQAGEADRRYLQNARTKALMVQRTGLDSRALATTDRHLLKPGDFPYAGGVKRQGIVVGVSGWAQEEDHWLAELVAGFVALQMNKLVTIWQSAHPEEKFLARERLDIGEEDDWVTRL